MGKEAYWFYDVPDWLRQKSDSDEEYLYCIRCERWGCEEDVGKDVDGEIMICVECLEEEDLDESETSD